MLKGKKTRPVSEKIARGNPGKRALTTAYRTPKRGAMLCPLHVAENERARGYWDHYISNVGPGHLAPIDSPLLARLCMCLCRIDEAEELMGKNMLVKAPNTGLPIQSPYMAIVNRQTDLARKLASELALPPCERNRLGVHDTAKEEADPAAKYFTG